MRSMILLLVTLLIAAGLSGAQDILFSRADMYTVGENQTDICSADFDGDGYSDLAVISDITDEVSILLNNGDGLFQTAVGYYVGHVPASVCAADFDGDGDIDLGVADRFINLRPAPDSISILLNDGNGGFDTRLRYPAGYGPWVIVAGDFDNDGDVDIAVGNAMSANITISFNYGNGTFAAPILYETGYVPGDIYSADLDGDGDDDLAVTDKGLTHISVLLNDGDGVFGEAFEYATAISADIIEVSDVDGDGDGDVTLLQDWCDSVTVLFNDGAGAFGDEDVYTLDLDGGGLACADLDNDGDEDIVVSASGYEAGWLHVLVNDGSGTFSGSPNSPYTAGLHGGRIIDADFDNDGDPDLAVASYLDDFTTVMINGCRLFECGDANDDEIVNVGDVVYLINYVFKSGGEPNPMASGDVNYDSNVNVGDAVYMINYIFKNGLKPGCGWDGFYIYYRDMAIDTVMVDPVIQQGETATIVYTYPWGCTYLEWAGYFQNGAGLKFCVYQRFEYLGQLCGGMDEVGYAPVTINVAPGEYTIWYRTAESDSVGIPVTVQ